MDKSIILMSLLEAKRELDLFIEDASTVSSIEKAATMMATCLSQGKKILCCGNGGSLCDATHFAEELTGRYRDNRRPYPAFSCNDPAYMTCTANDFSYDVVFSRWVEAFGKEGDILLAITTSGSSSNVVKAAVAAKKLGLGVVALTSVGDTPISHTSDVCISAPKAPHSDRIQEIHIKVIHILIQAIEKELGH